MEGKNERRVISKDKYIENGRFYLIERPEHFIIFPEFQKPDDIDFRDMVRSAKKKIEFDLNANEEFFPEKRKNIKQEYFPEKRIIITSWDYEKK